MAFLLLSMVIFLLLQIPKNSATLVVGDKHSIVTRTVSEETERDKVLSGEGCLWS